MEITYETIKPLIKKEELVDGNQIHLEFCAKNQEVALVTVAVLMADQSEITKNVSKQVLTGTIKNAFINKVFNLVGISGIARNFIKSSVNDIANQNQNSTGILKTEITKEKREKAITDAFKGIMAMYKFNEQSAEWEYIISH